MTPSPDDQLQTLAARLATQEQVIAALSERLAQRAADPDGNRSTLEHIRRSRAYRLALALHKLVAPLRLAKRLAALGMAAARTVLSRRRPIPGLLPAGKLRVRLDRPIPSTVAVGGGNVLNLSGWCHHPAGRIIDLRVTRDGTTLDMPVRQYTYPEGHPGHSLDSGFFAAVDLPPCDREATVVFGLEAHLADGSIHRADLERVLLRPAMDPGAEPPVMPSAKPGDPPLVAICMATYNPPPQLFARQVDSILAQTHTNWVCIITDDGSPADAFARIAALADRDPRFRVYRNPTRLGFYHNFERCLSLAPAEAEFIALSDHDDDWRPEKLATLLAAFDADATLVFSDMRIVTAEGECVSETYWTTRRNNYTNIASLLLANTVTGAASMFRSRLLGHVLPFPVRHTDIYHDHWIACAALALGKIGYVDRPLYDYVQHSRNVIGHCAPPTESRFKRVFRVVGKLFSPMAWDRWVTSYGRINYQRFAMAREFARLLLVRGGADVVSARRKSLRRFAAAERSWRSWVWLAGRGLFRRRVTLGYEYAMIVSVWWRALSGMLARRRPAAPPPPTSIYHWLPNRIARLKLLNSPAAPRRVNVILSVLDFKYVFGGYIAVFHLARKLAEAGRRVRLVTTDECRYEPAVWREKFRAYPGLEDFLDRVEVVAAHDRAIPIEVHPNDQFLATSWWTAHVAHKAAVELGRRSFVFLTQDYEPFFQAMSTQAALAMESYAFPHHAIYSTELLRDYFRQNGYGVYAAGREAGDRTSVALENAITAVGPVAATELAGRTPRKLLFYSRPEAYNARNLFELGVMALIKAIRTGVFAGDWEFYGIGSTDLTGQVALTDGAVLELLSRQSLADYAKTLKAHDVGLSLMFTPHPSLVPLEMASAGLLTVTNTYANKTADRLRAVSPNLIAVEATVPALVAGLRQAVAGVGDYEARARGARVAWSTDWDTSFPAPMLRTIGEFLDAGDPPAALREAA